MTDEVDLGFPVRRVADALRGEPAAFVDMLLSCLRGIAMTRLFGPDPAGSAAQLRALADTIVRRCSPAPLPPARRRPR